MLESGGLRVQFVSLSLEGGCGFHKSVHATPYGSWTLRLGVSVMSSVFFLTLYNYIYMFQVLFWFALQNSSQCVNDDVHGVKPDFKNYRIAGVIIIMPIINRGQINTMIDNNILI